MLTWIVLFFSNLVIPLCMLLGGFMLKNFSSGEINDFMGYRTRRSKQSPEAFRFAQVYCGKLWIFLGAIVTGFTVILQLFFLRAPEEVLTTLTMVLLVIHMAVLFGSILVVEHKLKQIFG